MVGRKENERTIHIDKEIHNKVKTFCNINGLKMKWWIAKTLSKEMKDTEKLYDNLQNDK